MARSGIGVRGVIIRGIITQVRLGLRLRQAVLLRVVHTLGRGRWRVLVLVRGRSCVVRRSTSGQHRWRFSTE